MELANGILNLAGDVNQQVQKWGVTPAEAAVLRYIHGSDALALDEVIGTVSRNDATERERLVQAYGRGQDGQVRCEAVEKLFPGLGSRLPSKFEDLPEIRSAVEEEETVEVFTPAPAKKSGKKAKAAAADAGAPAADSGAPADSGTPGKIFD